MGRFPLIALTTLISRKILSGITFNQGREKVGIIGRIGSGKSTIARLIVQLYDPDKGAIAVDGTDTRQIDPAGCRRNIAYLGQDRRCSRTAHPCRNITLAALKQLKEILAASGPLEPTALSRHPLGYDAPVGERGGGLAAGKSNVSRWRERCWPSHRFLFR